MVTSSLKEISRGQLGNRLGVRGTVLGVTPHTPMHPPFKSRLLDIYIKRKSCFVVE
jgi:hypothetical protein